MATMIPARSSWPTRMQAGERRFAMRLDEKLEDDYLVWVSVNIGPRRREADLVVLHPNRGLLVLEVKDWKPDTLQRIDRVSAELITERGLVTVANPLLQARQYMLELQMVLERDPALRHPPGHGWAGKLCVPVAHGVALTTITRTQFDAMGLEEVLPPHLVICRDEMLENADVETFQQRLWDMFAHRFGQPLSLPQIDRIRWHLFPDIRVTAPLQADLLDDQQLSAASAPSIPDLIRVMDLQQEQLARSLGDGHRVIHGVAGSGKTMILGYRCLHLARATQKPILVLCYNRVLSARLEQLIDARGLQAQVSVRTFHAWCGDMLRAYAVPAPKRIGRMDSAWFEAQVQAVIDGVDARAIPRGQYGAVLIDEGHDFEPGWLKLISQMVDPETNSLLLLYDDAQSVYAAKRRNFTFASVGIQAQGRTTVLRLNYRNTYEILDVARAFAGHALDASDAGEDCPQLIAPESAGRHGPQPEMIDCRNPQHEAEVVASRISDAIANGEDPNDIAVIYRNHWTHGQVIQKHLDRLRVPYRCASDSRSKASLFQGPPSVKLVTLHSSKGLEFESVYLMGLGQRVPQGQDAVTEARLLYVGMTRAMSRLVMTGVRLKPDSAGSAAAAPWPAVADPPSTQANAQAILCARTGPPRGAFV